MDDEITPQQSETENESVDFSTPNNSLVVLPEVNLEEEIEQRYRKAKDYILRSLRHASGKGKMVPISEVLTHFGITLPPTPSQAQIAQYNAFTKDIYPAIERLKDLRARAIEALHAKNLKSESTSNLTSLLKTVTGDIDTIENGADKSKPNQTLNIQISTEEFKNILDAYSEKKNTKIIDAK